MCDGNSVRLGQLAERGKGKHVEFYAIEFELD